MSGVSSGRRLFNTLVIINYILLGGATGSHYVDVLQDEVQQLTIGNYSSE